MFNPEALRIQLIEDFERLQALTVRYAREYEPDVKKARDRLEGAVEIKMALLERLGKPQA